jgi:hypothetical protein
MRYHLKLSHIAPWPLNCRHSTENRHCGGRKPLLSIDKLRVRASHSLPLQVGLVIDLTYSWRYYDPAEFHDLDVQHMKVHHPITSVKQIAVKVLDLSAW